jgi:ribose transport system ATP-binding protein
MHSPLATDRHALQVRGVAKAYGGAQALDGVTLNVEAGTIHALLGGNGSGKSTLIKILAGVVSADSGQLVIGGVQREAKAQTPAHARAGGLLFVHQQQSTFPQLSVAENLVLGGRYETGLAGRIKWSALRRRAQRVLEQYGIDVDPRTELGRLNPATQTLVTIARALQDREEAFGGVLVLDEPTARLPRREVDGLLASLQRYAEAGQTIVYVTHRLDEVHQVAHTATVLRDGRAVASLGRAQFDRDELVTLIAGRSLTAPTRRTSGSSQDAPAAEVVLEAKGLGIGAEPLCLRAGEVVGVAGLIGSGRTRLLRRIFGLGAAAHDQVSVSGQQVTGSSVRAAMRAGIAYVPEDRTADAAFADLSITRNISVADLGSYARWRGFDQRAEKARAAALMTSFQIRGRSAELTIAALSGGNQQKVVLARWLQRRPKVLLLDEPSQGVDVGARAEIHALIRRAVDEGAAALLVSSDFAELAAVADRVFIMRNGRIVTEIRASELSEDALTAAVYQHGAQQ